MFFADDRGWFYEFYKEETFKKNHLHYTFVQENQSFSKKGVGSGTALSAPSICAGQIGYSVNGEKYWTSVVDLRPTSKTFKQKYYCLLESSKRNMLLIPEGFAHGFSALEDSIFFYKCSNVYNRGSEAGIRWDDPDLKIEWRVENPIISGQRFRTTAVGCAT
jgi:dTDP-4-dehydrorhamnose 3,5-epimerase